MSDRPVRPPARREATRTSLQQHPLVQLTLVRVREFVREPEAVFWTMFFPILLTAEPSLDVQLLDANQATLALRSGRVALVAESGPGGVVYHYDDTNPEGRSARMLADAAVQRAGGRVDPVAVKDALVREPGSRYVDFLVPGLVGLGIMSNSVWGLGFSIVDSRRRKLIKRLVATPMSRTYYLMSYLLWRMMILGVEVAVPIGFGVLAFGVPVRGRVIDLIIVCIIASLAFSALGVLIASRAKTIEAASGLMNLLQIPMWILSGVFFSAQRFPPALQPVIQALPLTAVNDALRTHMLQGATLVQLAPQLATLLAWLVVSFTLALKLFRWR
jgi:ABC-2 type transport system permease protein